MRIFEKFVVAYFFLGHPVQCSKCNRAQRNAVSHLQKMAEIFLWTQENCKGNAVGTDSSLTVVPGYTDRNVKIDNKGMCSRNNDEIIVVVMLEQ